MKFNLKNRPHSTRGTRQYYNPEVDAWFEGFEKELRGLATQDRRRRSVKAGMATKERIELIKEILGE